MLQKLPACLAILAAVASAQGLEVVGVYDSGVGRGTEIISVQRSTRRAVVLVANTHVDLLDLAVPASPKRIARQGVGLTEGEEITSVAFHPSRDLYVAAVRAAKHDLRGRAVLVAASTGKILATVPVGYEPDHVAIDPTGRYAVVANEAESYWKTSDGFDSLPGSVSVVSLDGQRSAREVALPAADGTPGMVTAADGRKIERWIDGEKVMIPLDSGAPRHLEPEYLVFSPDGKLAYVTLQENNGIAVIDVVAAKWVRYIGLGKTRHIADVAEDGQVEFGTELLAMREPDGIAITPDSRYLVTADEGDTDPKASRTPRSAPSGGGRTLTIIDAKSGEVIADTGNQIDAAAQRVGLYPDDRSDSKGSEPEVVVVFAAVGRVYAAVGLERAKAVVLVDITNPRKPAVLGAIPLGGKSFATEGLAVLQRDGATYVYAANEMSGDVTVYRFVESTS